MLILALPGGAHLAAGLADSLQCGWSELAVQRSLPASSGAPAT